MIRRLGPLAAGVVLVACSAHEPPAATPTTTPTAPAPATAAGTPATGRERMLLAHIARMLDRAGTLRELPAKRPVAGAVLSRPELLAQLKAHVLKEVPVAAIVREGNALKLAGVMAKELDYEAIMFRLLEEQLAGFYSPEDKTMSLAGDLDEDMADATLLHELVHALQDQYFDLEKNSKYKPGESDRAFSRSALAEGDATSAMTDFMTGHAGEPDEASERALVIAMSSSLPEFAPPILQRSLIAPYVTGLRFVNAARRQGGWAAVDAVWKNPPVTSEQILHVEKYAAHEPELVVPAPAAAGLGEGFVADDVDTSGELGMRLLFESWFGHQIGDELASGWGGDRSTMARGPSGAVGLVEHVRYDANARPKAEKVAAALGLVWKVRQATQPRGIVAFCKERADLGPLAVMARSSATAGDVVFVMGPTNPTTWTSQGTCERALATARAELDR